MAANIMHIYRVDFGYANSVVMSDWVYARNAKQAKAYCKDKHRGERYDYYKAVMVGQTSHLVSQDASDLTEKEKAYIQNTPAKDGDKFAYHRN